MRIEFHSIIKMDLLEVMQFNPCEEKLIIIVLIMNAGRGTLLNLRTL